MTRFFLSVAGLALLGLATAPTADAQRRAPAEADRPGTVVTEAPASARSGVRTDDRDVPGQRARPPASVPARSAGVSDRDDPASPRVAARPVAADQVLSQGRSGAPVPVAQSAAAPNPHPNGRDVPPAALATRVTAPLVRAMTADGRALGARPGTPEVAAPEAALADAPTTGKQDAIATATMRLEPSVPNPTAGLTRLSFEVASSGPARIDVFDARGRRVATLFDATAEAGVRTAVTFDTRGLAAGSYVYVLSQGRERISRTLQVAR